MAFLRKNTPLTSSVGDNRHLSARSVTVLRWIGIPGAATALALWSVATLSGAYSATAPLTSATSFMPRLPASAGDAARPAAIADLKGKAGRVAVARLEAKANVSVFPRRTLNDRFETVVASVDLSPKKLAGIFARAGLVQQKTAHVAPARERFETPAKAVASATHAVPVTNRFGPDPAETVRASRLALALSGSSNIQLAYADPSPVPATSAFDAVLATPQDSALDAALEPDRPLFSELPDNIPLPIERPRLAAKPAAPVEEKATVSKQPVEEKAIASRPVPEEAPAKRSQTSRMVAFAKPENPTDSGGLAGAFSNLFSPKPKRPRSGVAIYDISAAKVYMPDGSVLEAHSGIGNMADNPRYVDQKMRGPTPPDTYNLTMRESLFHGVEALRMTPVSGKVGYNRSGILAHSYLLRGGRAESHGCVAFRDYSKFLKAFKQGKIRQLVVVPGSRGGRKAPSTAVAQNGRGA
nr:tlde1 domain-containing protein [Mesorhizobium sp.]